MFDGGILNSSSLVLNEDYSSQTIGIEKKDSYDLVLGENERITTTLILPDNKVFFAGSHGNWAVQTIIEGKFGDNVNSGSIGGHAADFGIFSSIITDDYKDSSEIVLGLMGYVAILNVETGVAEFPDGWIVGEGTGRITNIDSIGNSEYLVYDRKDGNILKVNTSTKEYNEAGKIEAGTGNYITSNYITLDNGSILFGTLQGHLFEYNPSDNSTKRFGDLETSAPIYTLTMISSNNCFVGDNNGEWWLYDTSEKNIISSGIWTNDEAVTSSINASMAIPDANNSEILASGSNGYWAVIDTNPNIPKGDESIINSGYFEGRKNIENCVKLGSEDSSTFIFSGSSKWVSAELVGSTSGFDKNLTPEVVGSLPNEINYKITMLNDYPDWPINIEKYKIKSTITDGSTNTDITSISTTFDKTGEIVVKINALEPNRKYNDLRIQLMKNDGETPIGEVWDTKVNLETTIGRVRNIDKVTLGDVSSKGFKFTVDTFDSSALNPKVVSEYTLKLNAQKVDGVLEEKTIWESKALTEAVDGTEYTVSGLDPGIKYEQITIQANYEDTGLVGDPLKLSSEITTKNIPKNLSGTIGEKTNTSFQLLANIEAENPNKKITDGYYMNVKDDNKLDYTSEKSYDVGENISFIIGDRTPGEAFKNLKISLSWDEEGKDIIEGCSASIDDVVIDNHISSIDVVKVEEKNSTSIKISPTVSADNNNNPITSPFKIQVFNTFESIDEPIYETEDIQKSGDLDSIIISGLTTKTSYHLQLQLVENSVKIGNFYDLGVVSTTSSKVTGIGENIEILNEGVTTHGFDASINIESENEAINVERYKLFFYNGEKDEPTWYRESSVAGKQVFSITGLSSSRTYDKCRFELWDSPDPDHHNVFTSKVFKVTTLGFVTSFNKGTLKSSNVKQKSFDLSFNVEDTFKEPGQENNGNKVERYWVIIFSNDDYENPIYDKDDNKEGYQFSGQVNLTVKGLKPHTKLTNIKIQFVDEKGTPFFGNPQSTGLLIKTKMSIQMISEMVGLSLIFLGLIIFTIVWTTKTLSRKRKEEKENLTHHLRGF